MARYRAPAVAFCMWLAASSVSAAADHPKYEPWLGAGGGTGFEANAFNTATDVASNPIRAGRNFMLSAGGIGSFGLAAAGEIDSASVHANGSKVVASSPIQRISGFILLEGLVVLLSAPAYAEDKGGALAGVTAGSAVLGLAAGNASPGPGNKIMFIGLLSLAALEIGLRQAGATEDTLFVTSVVGWNGIGYFATRAEHKEKARHRAVGR